jgi:beta-N-acetylhexosaminidase
MPLAYGEYLSTDSEEYTRLVHLVRDLHVGGLVVSLGDVYEEAILLNRLQQAARIPLLVAGDFERGLAMRVRRSTSFPDAMALGATRDPDMAYRMARVVAEEARAIGIHQTFAPVADVNTNPANPVINTRSFGDNVALVQSMVGAFVRGTTYGEAFSRAW